MINKEQIQDKLTQVIYPGFTKNIMEFGFVKEITITDTQITIKLDIPSSAADIENQLREEIIK